MVRFNSPNQHAPQTVRYAKLNSNKRNSDIWKAFGIMRGYIFKLYKNQKRQSRAARWFLG